MRRVIFAAARVGLVTAVALVAVAIALGRSQKTAAENRQPASPGYQPISGHLFEDPGMGLRLLDLETGGLERVRLPDGGDVRHAAPAPWRDERGRTHVVGLWNAAPGRVSAETATALVRFAVPGWEMLDRVEVDRSPASPPCWLPDLSSRILYASWDGQLYQFSFDEPGDGARPLAWRVARPKGFLMLATPSWPADRRLAGILLASVSVTIDGSRPGRPGESRWQEQLWWLKLSPDHTAIEDAGPLIRRPALEFPTPLMEENYPTVAADHDGRLVVAYLVRKESDAAYRLRLAPLVIDEAGRPSALGNEVIELPGDRIHAPPAFSTDGRWVHSTLRATDSAQGARVSVAEAFGKRSADPSVSRLIIAGDSLPPGSGMNRTALALATRARVPLKRAQRGVPACAVAEPAPTARGSSSAVSWFRGRSATRITSTARDDRVAQ